MGSNVKQVVNSGSRYSCPIIGAAVKPPAQRGSSGRARSPFNDPYIAIEHRISVPLKLDLAAFGRLGRGVRGPPVPSPARAAILAAFAGLVFHTFLYAAFLEDPLVWTLLAVGTALAAARTADVAAPASGRADPSPTPA